MNDLHYAIRMLVKRPGFTTVAVLTLALGIGANTSIFSVVNAVLLRPLPYREPGQLVRVFKQAPPGGGPVLGGGEFIAGPEYVAWKDQSQSLSKIAAYGGGGVNLTGLDQAERVVCGQVTAEFFPLLGVPPLLGRTFAPEEDRPNGPKVAILSHGLWQRRFGSDRSILGRTVTLDNAGYTVIGVLPPSFQFPEPFEIWTPLALEDAAEGAGIRISLVHVLARLKPNVTMAVAQAELETITQRLWHRTPTRPGPELIRSDNVQPAPSVPGDVTTKIFSKGSAGGPLAQSQKDDETPALAQQAPLPPPGNLIIQPQIPLGADQPEPLFGTGGRVKLVGLHEHVVGNLRRALLVLFGAVAFVLLIACANVANLLLARAVSRQRELAIRVALGAKQIHVVRQLLAESTVLALAGGAFGLVLAFWGVEILRSLSLANLPHVPTIGMDARVLGFTLMISLLTGLVFGLVPALHASRPDLNEALKEGTRSAAGRLPRQHLRHLFVISEVALALVLLISAGLMTRSFVRLREVNPGFQPDGVLTLQLNLAGGKHAGQEGAFFQELLQKLQALPGVKSAAVTDHLPLSDYSLMTTVQIEGRPRPNFGKEAPVSMAAVSPEYFHTMGIPLKQGRALTESDGASNAGVVVVNEAFVKRFLPNEDPIGKRVIGAGPGSDGLSIVGVVGDVRQSGPEVEVTAEIYRPYAQGGTGLASVVVRATGDPMGLATAVRLQVNTLDKDQPIYNLMPMEQRLAGVIAPRRLNMTLLGAFAALALLLAAIGICGVMSYAVTQRTHEIGIRLALGASSGDLLGLVVRQGMTLTLVGVGIGLFAAFALTRYLSGLLYSVKATDPATFLCVTLLLAGVAWLACYLPGRRAVRVDPMEALR